MTEMDEIPREAIEVLSRLRVRQQELRRRAAEHQERVISFLIAANGAGTLAAVAGIGNFTGRGAVIAMGAFLAGVLLAGFAWISSAGETDKALNATASDIRKIEAAWGRLILDPENRETLRRKAMEITLEPSSSSEPQQQPDVAIFCQGFALLAFLVGCGSGFAVALSSSAG